VTPAHIAVTMRRMLVDYPNGAREERDALAADWGRFLAEALPEAVWLPLPNLGEHAVSLAKSLNVTGLILSGGEDWGASPARDETERALLEWARHKRLPVLGVCRGAQVMQIASGGTMPCPATGHAGTRHRVRLPHGVREVNSFHKLGIPAGKLAPGFAAAAITEDGMWVEAFRHVALPWAGLLWHPEREAEAAPEDRLLLRRLFLELR